MKYIDTTMKPFIIACGIIHNGLQALVQFLSLKWLPPVYDQNKSDSSASDSNDNPDLDHPISSNWLEDSISSTVKQGPIKITRQCTVDTMEYLSDLPSYWPVPWNKRAYVVDLSDPKFNVYDKNRRLMTVDALIKNAVRTNFWIPCHEFNR